MIEHKKTTKWGQFLDARAEVIVEFAEEGRSDDEIARFLYMDKVQVKGIREWRQAMIAGQ